MKNLRTLRKGIEKLETEIRERCLPENYRTIVAYLRDTANNIVSGKSYNCSIDIENNYDSIGVSFLDKPIQRYKGANITIRLRSL